MSTVCEMQAQLEVVPGPPTSSWSCYVSSPPSFAFEWHYHEELELVLIERGSGQRYVGSSVERYAPGDLILVGSNVAHTWRSDSPGPHRAVVCQFKRAFLGSTFFDAVDFAHLKAMLNRSDGGLKFPAEQNLDVAELLAALPGQPPARRTLDLLMALSILSGRTAVRLSTVINRRQRHRSRHRIHDVIDIIHRRYAEPLSLVNVATEIAMTPGALSRSFRRTTGQSFSAYVNDVRCAAASRLLVESGREVARIAADCGYNSLANFNRRFRERFDTSPREYRAAFTDPA